MRNARHADEDEQERSEHQPHGHRSDREPEERRAPRRQQAREEQETGDDVLQARTVVGRKSGLRWCPARAHAEREHPRELVTVVGEDAPQHRVVAAVETGPQRDDEHSAAHDARLPGKHRPAAVADRLDPGREADVVVEGHADPGGSAPEHGPVARDGPEEPGMGPGCLREGEDREQDEEGKGDPEGQRFKKASGAHC